MSAHEIFGNNYDDSNIVIRLIFSLGALMWTQGWNVQKEHIRRCEVRLWLTRGVFTIKFRSLWLLVLMQNPFPFSSILTVYDKMRIIQILQNSYSEILKLVGP